MNSTRRARWPYFFPAAVALLFAGHALEDAGGAGAAPYLVIFIVCVVQVALPTVAGWWLLFALSLALGILVAVNPQNGPVDEWLVFVCLGFIPALALWIGRPWRTRAVAQAGATPTSDTQNEEKGA